MMKEEIKNILFDLILKNSSPTMGDKRTIDYQQTMVIIEELINHETDLLKEFVEWLKEQCKDVYQLYNEEMQEETNLKNSMWFIGRKDGIGEIRQLLKVAIEKFLEAKR